MKIKMGKLTVVFNASISWDKPYMKRVIQSIREGRKIQAVKIYKDNTGLGLRESIDYINSIWATYYKPPKKSFVDELVSFQAEQYNK